MSAVADRSLRIGELAAAVGTTARTIRYYEEIGLLVAGARPAGQHRTYDQGNVERLREIMRLRDLLGISLEDLKEIVDVEEARPALRAEFERSHDAARRREILVEALAHIDHQLELVRRRTADLERLRQELTARRRRVRARLKDAS